MFKEEWLEDPFENKLDALPFNVNREFGKF